MTKTTGTPAVLLSLFAIGALAQQPVDNDDGDLSPKWRDRIAPMHRTVTRWVDNTARGIDNFFGTADSYRTDNDSYLRLRTDLRWTELESWDNSELDHKFRLDLPTAKERLRLIFESDPTREERGVADTLPSQAREGESGSLFGIGSQSRRKDPHEGWVARLQGGVRLRTPIDPYARITFGRAWWMGNWEGELRHRADWFDSRGYSLDNRFDLAQPLSDRWLLRFTTDANWKEEIDKLWLVQSANLSNVLSPRSVITYSTGVIAESLSSTRANNFFLVANYRRDLHRQLLYLEVIPELTFPREADFDATWGFTVRLELYFRDEF
jgi:hypothetical protein